MAGRDAKRLGQTVERNEQRGGQALACPGDVGQRADVKRWVETIEERFGGLHGLINSAAQIGPPRFLEDAEHERFEQTLRTNLLGPQRLIHAATALLGRDGGGAVVNVT